MVGAVEGVGVHGRGREPRDRVDQSVFGADRDVMGLDDRAARVDRDLALGPERGGPPPPPAAPPPHPARGGARGVASACPAGPGSPLPISRRPPSRAACHPTTRIATVMSRPTTGSAHLQPIATPPAPTSTASEVNPSVRACRPP